MNKSLSKKVNRTRDKTFYLRFSQEEIDEINEKIAKSRLSKTEFVLKCVRENPVIVIPDLSEAMTEVRLQGASLNRIAHAMNEYAVGLRKHGTWINVENAEWRAFPIELEDLRKENEKTQKLLWKIFMALEKTAK